MVKCAVFILLGMLFTCLFYNVCLKQGESSGTFMVNSCSCEVTCNGDDDIFPSSEEDEPQKNIPVIWKSLNHNSLDFSEFCTAFINIQIILNISCCCGYALRTVLKRVFITLIASLKKRDPTTGFLIGINRSVVMLHFELHYKRSISQSFISFFLSENMH